MKQITWIPIAHLVVWVTNLVTISQKEKAINTLAACLLEMAKSETNPVLQVINPTKPLKENKKYPTDLLQFNHLGWRAYYHCHPASRVGNHRFKGEHGHFHLFVRTSTDSKTKSSEETWSHVAALAMDNMGQPLGWFTVNHWVTGETWEPAASLVHYLNNIPFDQPMSLVETWLLSMLLVSKDEVCTILNKRDQIIKEKELNADNENIMQDKSVYLLSEAAVNIKELLNIKGA